MAAIETLSKNEIKRKQFSELVINNLTYSRGKGRNLIVCGLTNCAKLFILIPLSKISKCFMTLSHGIYNWVDASQKEVLFFNDLRYEIDGEKQVIPWNIFLDLLEVATVLYNKKLYSKYFEWSEAQSSLATADKPIVRIVNSYLYVDETQQMNKRLLVLTFKRQYQGRKVNYNLIPCVSYFTRLILDA